MRTLSRLLIALGLMWVGIVPLEARTACDPEVLRRIALQRESNAAELEHFFYHGTEVDAGMRVRLKASPDFKVTQADLRDLMHEMALGDAQVFHNPSNSQQLWVKVKGEDEYRLLMRNAETIPDGAGGTLQEVTYTYRGTKPEVPPGMLDLYPELARATEGSRDARRVARLETAAAGRQLPTTFGDQTLSQFEAMSRADFEAYVRRTGNFPYVPPKGATDIPVRQCGKRPCFEDAFGNLWVSGPTRTAGEAFEWDVQVGSAAWVREISGGKPNLNVSPVSGRLTHGQKL